MQSSSVGLAVVSVFKIVELPKVDDNIKDVS